jgi:hypothetical protein
MLTSTIYDVKIRYSVDGRGASGVRGITNEVRTLGRESGRVTSLLHRMGAAVVATFGARAAGKALIGFNATVEDTKTQIGGMLALSKKTDLVDQIGTADRLFANLQRRARTLPGTTSEYTRMAGSLTQPITDAGLGMKDLEDMTVGSVVAAKALGYQWDLAARDIDQALRGQFHATDPFAGKVLGSMGYKGEEGRAKFNNMSASDRADTLRRALTQKQLVQLAAAQGQSFNGSLSTLQDTIEQFFGKVGVPLFKTITAEIKHWNAWLDDNEQKVDAFATKLANGLVTGFGVVKDVVTFLVDHADTLLTIGKVWAAVKIGGMVGNLGSAGGTGLVDKMSSLFSAGGFFRRATDQFNPETGGYEFTGAGRGFQPVGGMKGAAGNLGLLGQSLAIGYTIGTMFDKATGASSKLATSLASLTGRIDKTTLEFERVNRGIAALDSATESARGRHKDGLAGTYAATGLEGVRDVKQQELEAMQAFFEAKSKGDLMSMQKAASRADALGLGSSDVSIANMVKTADRVTMLTARMAEVRATGGSEFTNAFLKLSDYQQRTLDVQKAQEQTMRYVLREISAGHAVDPNAILDILRNATDDPTGKGKGKLADKPNVNITIQRIEVQSEDPDRYAFGLVEAFRDAVKNPSAAVRAIREG